MKGSFAIALPEIILSRTFLYSSNPSDTPYPFPFILRNSDGLQDALDGC